MAGNIPETADHVVGRIVTVLWRIRHAYYQYRERIEAQLSPRQQRLFNVFLFLSWFTVLSLPLYLVLDTGWDATALRNITAAVATQVLSLAGLPVSNTGSFIYGEQLILDVSRDSTGWKSVMALCALIVATREAWSYRLAGIVTGVTALFAVNVFRVTSMFYAVEVFNVPYELMHTILWRWGLTVTVLAIWGMWLSDRLPGTATVAAFLAERVSTRSTPSSA